MRKIVAFKKDLLFKTKVCEITSISLEHKILEKDDDLVSGEFIISGEYKMTEGSINREKYNFTLPFDIALNSNYDVDSVNVEIDNFYYEILNNDILKVKIDLMIEASEKEIVRKEIELINDNNSDEVEELTLERDNIEKENEFEDYSKIIEIDNKYIKEEKDEIINNVNINTNTNIFNVDNGETYSTYYVYIVKEDDNIDKILDRYSITKEDLELYNDISSIKPFDKIIIPTNGR